MQQLASAYRGLVDFAVSTAVHEVLIFGDSSMERHRYLVITDGRYHPGVYEEPTQAGLPNAIDMIAPQVVARADLDWPHTTIIECLPRQPDLGRYGAAYDLVRFRPLQRLNVRHARQPIDMAKVHDWIPLGGNLSTALDDAGYAHAYTDPAVAARESQRVRLGMEIRQRT